MTEVEYQHRLVECMTAFGWFVQPHNDRGFADVPDLSFSVNGKHGWIEIKYVDEPPKTLDHISHFTLGQERWLKEAGNKGAGNCYLWIGSPECHWAFPHWAFSGPDFRSSKFKDIERAAIAASTMEKLVEKLGAHLTFRQGFN